MKYIKYFLLFLFIPFIALAKNDVEIKSVSLVDKSEEVTELEKAKYNGLKLDFSLKYINKNDFAKYKVIIKNNSDKDYEVDSQTTFNDGEFIKYEYTIDNNKKVLKGNEELTMFIIITYFKDVDDSKFIDGKYNEKNNVYIELSNDNIIDEGEKNIISFVTNPETNANEEIVFIVISAILCILIIISLKDIKTKTFMLIIVLLSTPIFVNALEKIKIDVETYIEIDKNSTMYIKTNDCDKNTYQEIEYFFDYTYITDMTFKDFINSSKYNELTPSEKNIFIEFFENPNYVGGREITFEYYELKTCDDFLEMPENASEEEMDALYENYNTCRKKYLIEDINLDSKIISKKKGFYFFKNDGVCLQ